ncbi:MAG: hypothetical protein PVI63_10890, partial [Anaerolineae bacterium]
MRQYALRLAFLALIALLTPAGCRQATPAPQEATAGPPATATTEPAPTPSPEALPASETELLAPESVPQETYYAPFPLSITLDGDFSDWEAVPRVTLPEEAKEYPGLSAVTFAAAADETHLYFMGDVTDDNIISGEHGTDYWNEDSVEF